MCMHAEPHLKQMLGEGSPCCSSFCGCGETRKLTQHCKHTFAHVYAFLLDSSGFLWIPGFHRAYFPDSHEGLAHPEGSPGVRQGVSHPGPWAHMGRKLGSQRAPTLTHPKPCSMQTLFSSFLRKFSCGLYLPLKHDDKILLCDTINKGSL